MAALIRTIALAGAVAFLFAGAPAPVLAGGDDYDAANDTENEGPAYFGFVRDHRGAPVSDARVTLRPKSGEPVSLKSNVLGLYRSHIRKGVSPDEVEVLCEKAGYRQSQVQRRNPPGSTDMNIETNCTLQRL
jgi:hypothetical protein